MKDTIENSSFYSRPRYYSIKVKNKDGKEEEKIFDNESNYYRGFDLSLGWYSQYFMEGKVYTKNQLKNKAQWEKNFDIFFDHLPDILNYLNARYATYAAQKLDDEIVQFRGKNSIEADCYATENCIILYKEHLLNKKASPDFDDDIEDINIPEKTKE